MVKLALYVQLEAKPSKEREVEEFLKGELPLVEAERGTETWFALKRGATTFGIFDTFSNEGDRETQISGAVAEALMAKASELFASPPSIHKIEILAEKLPR